MPRRLRSPNELAGRDKTEQTRRRQEAVCQEPASRLMLATRLQRAVESARRRSPSRGKSMDTERRWVPHYPLSAAAEIVEVETDAHTRARTSELGLLFRHPDSIASGQQNSTATDPSGGDLHSSGQCGPLRAEPRNGNQVHWRRARPAGCFGEMACPLWAVLRITPQKLPPQARDASWRRKIC